MKRIIGLVFVIFYFCLSVAFAASPHEEYSAEEWFKQGNQHFALGEYTQAIENYQLFLKYADPDSQAKKIEWINKQLSFLQELEKFTKDIEKNPQDYSAYYNRGIVYERLFKGKLAIQDFTKVIEINPNYAEAYYNRGLAYWNINQFVS